jgi:hypothetical protein
VEWAQCNNPRAPRTVTEAAQSAKAREKAKDKDNEGTAYECGEVSVYKTETLESKKGDRASHVITFVPPPNAACWEGDALPTHPAANAGAAPDAGGPAAAEDAGAAAAADAGAVDAGAVRDGGGK